MMDTKEEDKKTHMLRLSVDNRQLARIAKRQHQVPDRVDDGYAVHGLLSALFGNRVPKPFALTELRSEAQRSGARKLNARTTILAYGEEFDYAQHAQEFASPDAYTAVDWASFATKAMVTRFDEGRRLGFECRACPTVRSRLSKDGPRGDRSSAEVDAFLAAQWASKADEPTRLDAYTSWFQARLGEAARCESLELTRFLLTPAFRKGKSAGGRRKGHPRRRPDATMRGVLQVTDTGAFERLLIRGIGRHRSFGFGMLLLHPAPC